VKPIYEKLTLGSEEGFTFKRIQSRDFTCPWHFHGEYELILTHHCPGYRMVGDDVTPLHPGDLVLVGANLPHIWQCDPRVEASRRRVDILLVQFEEDFLGDALARVPALYPVRQLLQRAAVGLQFTGLTRDRVAGLLHDMAKVSGLRRVVLFLSVLEVLASSSESHAIASPGFTADLSPFNQERMNRVFKFIDERIDQPVRLTEAARVAGLSSGAFSRFFHRHTGRTFPEFLNQVRVGRACRLLAESELSITEIALASGFANLSNFNRQFARLKRTTPREYRRMLSGES
jgi:AraC-like DNA-binding protein